MPGETGDTETIWLSGHILTFLNKLFFPILWLTIIIGVPLWVLVTRGRLSIRPDFWFIVLFALVGTVIMGWVTLHLQSLGYRGGELVVANYWRKAYIPFHQVASIERVWWYRGRLVRVRFNRPTPFGTMIYYTPAWGPLRAMFSSPDKQLRAIIASRTVT